MSETQEQSALRAEIERLRMLLRETRPAKGPQIGECEVVGRFRNGGWDHDARDWQSGPCGRPARHVAAGKTVCGVHFRALNKRSWQTRILDCARNGRAANLNKEEVVELAALLSREP